MRATESPLFGAPTLADFRTRQVQLSQKIHEQTGQQPEAVGGFQTAAVVLLSRNPHPRLTEVLYHIQVLLLKPETHSLCVSPI
jgi:hypothetical protein